MSPDPHLVEIADELDIEPAELIAIFEDVQSVLRDLAQIEIDVSVPADLERVRRALPADPVRAQLLSAALPDPLRQTFEYVRPSEHQAGYWRRSRERSDPSQLSDAELRRNLALQEIGNEIRGTEGTVQTADGREIPVSAAKIGERMAGRSFKEDGSDRGDGSY